MLKQPDDLHEEADLSELLATAVLGEAIERALYDRTSPFALFMRKAREEFKANAAALIDVDLTTQEGIAKARTHQQEAQRYCHMLFWLNEAKQKAEEAEQELEQLDEEESEAVQQLQEAIHGKRSKPAPDE